MLLLLPVPLLWAWFAQEGNLRFADDLLLDWRFRARGELDAPVPIIYVDMDTRSLSELGGVPWPRSYFADVSTALIDEGKAKGVGIDVLFSEKGRSEAYDQARWVGDNVQFARYLRRGPPVVLAASYAAAEKVDQRGRRTEVPFPLLGPDLPPVEQIEPPELPEFGIGNGMTWNPPRIGLIDTLDRATRWVPLFAPTSIKRYEHMALGLALLYWGAKPEDLRIGSDAIEVPGPDGKLLATIPLIDGQLLEVNWFSSWISPHNPRISFSIVYIYANALKGDNEQAKANAREFFKQFNNAIVLIGPVDELLQDLAVTPMDDYAVPKVGVHGNVLKTLISGEYLHRLPLRMLWILTIGLTLVVTALAISGGARSIRAKLTAALVIVAYVWLCFNLFASSHLVLPMAAPLGSALMASFLGVLWQLAVEEKQKGRIKGMFSAYLAPTVVNNLIESGREPELGGHEEEITAYFSDIQSFSTFSEQMSPARLVELMNEYLTACTDLVQAGDGTLDKYIGDAVVAMYGAPLPLPDHAFRACETAHRVQQQLDELRAKWRGEGDRWPTVVHNLRARIGLNTGPAIIGNMGSRSRFNYTMMGDNVNLAARMESGAKLLGVFTMVTDSTRNGCEKHAGDRLVFRFLDKIVVKGRSLPVPVHELVGLRTELPAQTHECLALHAAGMERYLAQDWVGAQELFHKSAVLEPFQPDPVAGIGNNPSLIMFDRCAHMRAHPPGPDWDGVYVMKEKG